MSTRNKNTAFVILGLAGTLALAWTVGAWRVHAGWEPPSWIASILPSPGSASGGSELFCTEHGVPESLCTLCHPDLEQKLTRCVEHGLPEEICTICHPEAKRKHGIGALCKPHGLPEHFCVLCNPALRSEDVKSDWCASHLVPKSLCTRCDPELTKSLSLCAPHSIPTQVCTLCRPELARSLATCAAHGRPFAFCKEPECEPLLTATVAKIGSAPLPLVRMASPTVAEKAGIQAVPARLATISPALKANGTVAYDEATLTHIRARVSGVIQEILRQEGDAVEQGQTLAVIDSAELGEAKSDYLASTPAVELWARTSERNKQLSEKGVASSRSVLEAEAELQQARALQLKTMQKLRNWGLDEKQIERLGEEKESERSRQGVSTPLRGTVVARKAVRGETVEASDELFTVADLSAFWVHFNVHERDLRRVAVGQQITFRVPGLSPAEFTGKVLWMDTGVDERARTVRVRARVENPAGLLRANMFGSGEIALGEPRTALLVPKDAVQRDIASFVVFVRKSPGEFEPRRVVAGEESGGWLELAWADLKPGEEVVTTGSFLLKTEIQKSSIGAGCCGE